MKQIRCPNDINGKPCGKLLCNAVESINATVVVQSNSKKNMTDLEIKCTKCGSLISIRFPRGSNPNIVFARGIKPE